MWVIVQIEDVDLHFPFFVHEIRKKQHNFIQNQRKMSKGKTTEILVFFSWLKLSKLVV